MDFAKVFNTEKFGQLCAIRASENEDGKPEIRVFCEPSGLGVCSSAILFEDSDIGWDKQESTFESLTEEQAALIVQPIFQVSGHPLA